MFAAVSHLPHLLAFALVDAGRHAAGRPVFQLRRQRLSRFHPHRRRFAGDVATSARPIVALREQLTAYRKRLDEFDRWLARANGEDIPSDRARYACASSARRAWQRHIEHGEPMPRLGGGGRRSEPADTGDELLALGDRLNDALPEIVEV